MSNRNNGEINENQSMKNAESICENEENVNLISALK
jgi:hypothetical protein